MPVFLPFGAGSVGIASTTGAGCLVATCRPSTSDHQSGLDTPSLPTGRLVRQRPLQRHPQLRLIRHSRQPTIRPVNPARQRRHVPLTGEQIAPVEHERGRTHETVPLRLFNAVHQDDGEARIQTLSGQGTCQHRPRRFRMRAVPHHKQLNSHKPMIRRRVAACLPDHQSAATKSDSLGQCAQRTPLAGTTRP